MKRQQSGAELNRTDRPLKFLFKCHLWDVKIHIHVYCHELLTEAFKLYTPVINNFIIIAPCNVKNAVRSDELITLTAEFFSLLALCFGFMTHLLFGISGDQTITKSFFYSCFAD